MGRFRNKATGVVVSVSDEKDVRFDEGWESADFEPSSEAQGPDRPEDVEPVEADTEDVEQDEDAPEGDDVEAPEPEPAPVKRRPGRPRKTEQGA